MKGLQIVTSLLLLAALCKADKDEEEFAEIAKKCADDQELTKEQINDMPRAFCAGEELDQKFRCYMACLYKKLEVIKDGEVQAEEIKKSILPEIKNDKTKKILEERLDKCKDSISGIPDECEQAATLSKCLFGDSEFCEKMA